LATAYLGYSARKPLQILSLKGNLRRLGTWRLALGASSVQWASKQIAIERDMGFFVKLHPLGFCRFLP